ncbi:MAG: V-type ATP synthase subunit E family protein [Sphaerochaetaceae bacterium]|jgi:vacuolar-type H+-ATPase subunit E/Vma4
MNEYTDQLFAGILESAKSEATSIIEQAQKDADAIAQSYEKRIADTIALEKKTTNVRLEAIAKVEESTIRNLERKHQVSYSERLRVATLQEVALNMEKLIQTKEYPQILIGWIAEAAIGLDRERAVVHCSFKEKVDEAMLRQAEEIVLKTVGKKVSLTLGSKVLSSQGIEVVSEDGKVAYNNQVATRLVRSERELKELMEGEPCHKG